MSIVQDLAADMSTTAVRASGPGLDQQYLSSESYYSSSKRRAPGLHPGKYQITGGSGEETLQPLST